MMPFGRRLTAGERRKLGAHRLFVGVPDSVADRSLSDFRTARLPRGTWLFRVRDPAQHVHLVTRGIVYLGSRLLLVPGDLVGEAAVLGAERRTFAARCIVETVVCSISAERALRTIDAAPVFALNLARIIHERLDRTYSIREILAGTR